MERTQNVSEIFDADSVSLSRIQNEINRIYEVLERELTRVDTQEQSAVFKDAVLKTSQILAQTATVLNEAQNALVVPEFLRTQEPF
jgi:hypothetical protein